MFEEAAMALKVGAEHSGDGQDVVAVGHGSQHVIEDEAGGGLDVLLVAGGAEPTALAGESEQVFVLAVVAANPGEAAGQVAALDEFVDDLGDDAPQEAVAGLVLVGIGLFTRVVVAVGVLPTGRLPRVSGA